jgi:hypothetical protein
MRKKERSRRKEVKQIREGRRNGCRRAMKRVGERGRRIIENVGGMG